MDGVHLGSDVPYRLRHVVGIHVLGHLETAGTFGEIHGRVDADGLPAQQQMFLDRGHEVALPV